MYKYVATMLNFFHTPCIAVPCPKKWQIYLLTNSYPPHTYIVAPIWNVCLLCHTMKHMRPLHAHPYGQVNVHLWKRLLSFLYPCIAKWNVKKKKFTIKSFLLDNIFYINISFPIVLFIILGCIRNIYLAIFFLYFWTQGPWLVLGQIGQISFLS